jgi:hypothetical protein
MSFTIELQRRPGGEDPSGPTVQCDLCANLMGWVETSDDEYDWSDWFLIKQDLDLVEHGQDLIGAKFCEDCWLWLQYAVTAYREFGAE